MEKCLKKTVKELKEELKANNVQGRSKLTTKQQMCEVLVAIQSKAKSSGRTELPVEIASTNILSLPRDAQLLILKELPSKDLLNICKVNKRFRILCKDDLLWKELYRNEFGGLRLSPFGPLASWYENYREEFINREKYKEAIEIEDKIDSSKSWSQNWQEYNEFELVVYRFRPFAGVFRKITPLEQRRSAFENQGSVIRGTIPIQFYDKKLPTKERLYVIYQNNETNPVSPVFSSQKQMNDYRRKKGWVFGGESKRYIREVQNYLWENRMDLQ